MRFRYTTAELFVNTDVNVSINDIARQQRVRDETNSGCTGRRLGCSRRSCCSCASSRRRRRRYIATVRHTSCSNESADPSSPAPRSRPPRTDTRAATGARHPDHRRHRCRPAVKVCRPGTPRRSATSLGRNRRRGRDAKRPARFDTVPQRVCLNVININFHIHEYSKC